MTQKVDDAMASGENSGTETAPDPALRRQAILHVAALTLLLLALPVGMVVWAVRDSMRPPPAEEIVDVSAEETDALRMALEQMVADAWGEVPSLMPSTDHPVLPVLEWKLGFSEWTVAADFVRSQMTNNPAKIILLQEGSSLETPARFMIAPDFWQSTLSPALEEKNLSPPEAPQISPGGSFLFLEIHGANPGFQ